MKLLILSLVFTLNSHAMVYNTDDRTDALPEHEHSAKLLAQIPISKFDFDSLTYINKITLKERHNLCDGEKNENKESLAECSAFLVDEDLIMTAGHCLDLNGDSIRKNCEEHYWVLDHYQTNSFKEENVFKCKSVEFIRADYEENSDYALIRLDRKINRDAFKLSLERPTKDQELLSLGFPHGMTMINSGMGNFQGLDHNMQYLYSLDLFGGNSGSPIINTLTNEVIAVHIKGPAFSLYEDIENKCFRENSCDEDEEFCSGSNGFPIRKMSSYIFKRFFNNENSKLY